MQDISIYHQEFVTHLNGFVTNREPENLYNPINYILSLGGKRLRPILTLMTADIFSDEYHNALNAALAVEVFHNFSLVHDDIMDEAPLRRGKETVHKKWDLNTGILSGDAMLILAYQLFEKYEPETFQQLAKLFSKTALEVCEGQQYDVDFETRNDVTQAEYITMITYKTAVLVGAAMQMGAIVAKANCTDAENIYNFGSHLGIAFQLQDDYLDAFGDPETFGKQVGGDIIENKKTYLYLKALEFGNANHKEALTEWFNTQPENPEEKVDAVKHLFIATGADKHTQEAIEYYTQKAFDYLDAIAINQTKKEALKAFGNGLMKRTV